MQRPPPLRQGRRQPPLRSQGTRDNFHFFDSELVACISENCRKLRAAKLKKGSSRPSVTRADAVDQLNIQVARALLQADRIEGLKGNPDHLPKVASVVQDAITEGLPDVEIEGWLRQSIQNENQLRARQYFSDVVLPFFRPDLYPDYENTGYAFQDRLSDLISDEFKDSGQLIAKDKRRKVYVKSREDEELQSSLNIIRLFGMSDINQVRLMIAPRSLYKRTYMLLDTDNALEVLDNNTRFRFNFLPQNLQEAGGVATTAAVRDLVGMRVFPITAELILTRQEGFTYDDIGEDQFPVGFPAPDDNPVAYRNRIINLYNNFTLLIEEFAAQSFVASDGRKYHFSLFPQLMNIVDWNNGGYLFHVPDDPYYEFVTSGQGNGWFWFKKPITDFSTITIQFRNPEASVTQNQTTRLLVPIELTFLDPN